MRLDNTDSRQDDTLSEADNFNITGIEVGKLCDVTELVGNLVDIVIDLDEQLTEALKEKACLEKELAEFQ